MSPAVPKGAWILTDGKAGDLVQCEGVCQALGVPYEVRTVAPRGVWQLPVKGLPVDPREREDRPDSPLAGPVPDLVVASGRRTIPYLKRAKALRPDCFTVYLKDPRTGTDTADFIWVPEHDKLRGANVLATLTSPHKVTAGALEAARAAPPPEISRLARPRVAVLIGGDSAHMSFTKLDIQMLAERLKALAASGAALMATFSRRTDDSNPTLKDQVTAIVRKSGGYLWDGTGDNPYLALLALADGIVVTTDSVNMVGEAVSTGVPVMIFRPTDRKPRTNRKIHDFLQALAEKGAVRSFTGDLETVTYEPLNSTPVIAGEIARRYAAFVAERQRSS
ncbi:MAG: mitochondrial fission ELM1 family protein [Rhodobiaceae bacterium]|nr:mitochondrial fission ELM1 family protein [Rhodobiaceae bacterium]